MKTSSRPIVLLVLLHAMALACGGTEDLPISTGVGAKGDDSPTCAEERDTCEPMVQEAQSGELRGVDFEVSPLYKDYVGDPEIKITGSVCRADNSKCWQFKSGIHRGYKVYAPVEDLEGRMVLFYGRGDVVITMSVHDDNGLLGDTRLNVCSARLSPSSTDSMLPMSCEKKNLYRVFAWIEHQ